jgi:pilus assembly protein CpaF
MRLNRIIVGECRGIEALDMLQAMNTGHDGSLSTGHANSAFDMLSRLETMVLMGAELPLPAIRRQIASGIDILVHLGRMRDRSRKVLEVMEMDGMNDEEIMLRRLCHFCETAEMNGKIQGEWVWNEPLIHQGKLQAAGHELIQCFGNEVEAHRL